MENHVFKRVAGYCPSTRHVTSRGTDREQPGRVSAINKLCTAFGISFMTERLVLFKKPCPEQV
jgi:hypothetical protein